MALGEQLRNARLKMNLTASQVAAETRMKVQMIDQIEHEDFHKVAAPIYGKGFIKLYAEFVGLDPKPLIDEYMFRFVDNGPDFESNLEVPKERNESEFPAALKKTQVPEKKETASVPQKPAQHEDRTSPARIERAKETTRPAGVRSFEAASGVKRIPEDSVTQVPGKSKTAGTPEKKKESGAQDIPDLFDAANISRQREAMSLADEARMELDHLAKDTEEEPQKPQLSLMDIFVDVYEAAADKCGDIWEAVKEKTFDWCSGLKKAGKRVRPGKALREKLSDAIDFLQNPAVITSSIIVIVVVLIVMAWVNRKPSTEVPVEGRESAELELVEEPPAPYVD